MSQLRTNLFARIFTALALVGLLVGGMLSNAMAAGMVSDNPARGAMPCAQSHDATAKAHHLADMAMTMSGHSMDDADAGQCATQGHSSCCPDGAGYHCANGGDCCPAAMAAIAVTTSAALYSPSKTHFVAPVPRDYFVAIATEIRPPILSA